LTLVNAARRADTLHTSQWAELGGASKRPAGVAPVLKAELVKRVYA